MSVQPIEVSDHLTPAAEVIYHTTGEGLAGTAIPSLEGDGGI